MHTCTSVTTDCGTELLFGYMPLIDPDARFPWRCASLHGTPQDPTHDALPDMSSVEPVTLYICSAMRCPGVEHDVHAAMLHTCTQLEWYAEWLCRAKAVSKYLGSKLYRDILKAALLPHTSQLLHSSLDPRFKSFVGNRALSIKCVCEDLMQWESLLVGRFLADIFAVGRGRKAGAI